MTTPQDDDLTPIPAPDLDLLPEILGTTELTPQKAPAPPTTPASNGPSRGDRKQRLQATSVPRRRVTRGG